MLGYVYGQTTSRWPSPEMLPTGRGPTYRRTTFRVPRLGKPALEKARFWNQSGGAYWEPLRTSIVWVAG